MISEQTPNEHSGATHCSTAFRAGDTVLHRPTGETWILAVDQFGDRVSPCGWPETIAGASDCELKVAASNDERADQLKRSSEIREPHDVRRLEARHQLMP